MKNHLGTVFGIPSLGAAAAITAFCAFVPVSRADVIVNNTADAGAGSSSGSFLAGQVFTMPATGGDLSSLALVVNFGSSATVEVDLYNVSGGAPTGSAIANLGNVIVTGGGSQQLISVSSLNPFSLSANTSYAIVLQTSGGNVGWENTTTAGSGGSGTLGGLYYDTAGWTLQNSGNSFAQMSLQVVPEVPITGIFMGIGALALAAGHTLRRKFSPSLFNS